MLSIFGLKAKVFFGKITNWGTFTEEEFKVHKIWDPTHPYYGEFVRAVNAVVLKKQVFHNLQEFIKFKESKILRSSLVMIAKIPNTEISNPDN